GITAGALLALAATALRGYYPPEAPGVDLRFPLDDGHYYVAAAGSSLLINHHLVTLTDDFRRDYRGQSYGVDITRLNALGVTALGIMPEDPGAYAIFGTPVRAPCSGRVSRSHDGAPDMPVPRRDLGRPLGNHVFIDCQDATVVLAHLQRGSVSVRTGQRVATGAAIARVGNSGQTTAPHLHIHAQRGGVRYAPLRATPLVIRFSGRYPVRNSRFRR
ncbi:M23 family metallopeptidase, partial [Ectothiorhodospiraceae bacterium WFHF3C12]|nr:M23 family metallopeptidase [Ectothiorhodospiraceae bacterium WFHF3C12]